MVTSFIHILVVLLWSYLQLYAAPGMQRSILYKKCKTSFLISKFDRHKLNHNGLQKRTTIKVLLYLDA